MEIKVYNQGTLTEEICNEVSILLHDSFRERWEKGLTFACGLFSPKDVENQFIRGGYLLIAFNSNGKAVGTLSLLRRERVGLQYAGHDNLAVAPDCMNQGIASKLFKKAVDIAKNEEWAFLTSSTAVEAHSSVAYHRKNGFIIYQKSFSNRYDSYDFILPIKKLHFLKCDFLRLPIYYMLLCRNYINFKLGNKTI